jgi:hypothetical protein
MFTVWESIINADVPLVQEKNSKIFSFIIIINMIGGTF